MPASEATHADIAICGPKLEVKGCRENSGSFLLVVSILAARSNPAVLNSLAKSRRDLRLDCSTKQWMEVEAEKSLELENTYGLNRSLCRSTLTTCNRRL